MSDSIYLDHAAATPLDSEVLAQMQPFLTAEFYNPSATYLAAKKVRSSLDDARARVAKVLAVRPREIVFTAGATEANNLAIKGVMDYFIEKFPGSKILVSAIEHDSVLKTASQYNHSVVPVDKLGRVNQTELRNLITDDVVMVSIMYANNEIGTIQKLNDIAKIIDQARTERSAAGNNLPIYLHTDAAQAPNLLPIVASNLGVDLMSLNGGKIYGPKQSGALFIATGTQISSVIQGGGQEFGMRSGTENVAGIVGFSYALERAASLRAKEADRLADLHNLFVSQLASKVPKAVVTAPGAGLYNLVHITIAGTDNERLMMELDEAGIQCAVGSACSASSDQPSHVLQAIGLSEEQAQTSLRFTMGRSTTKQDIEKTVDTLAKLVG